MEPGMEPDEEPGMEPEPAPGTESGGEWWRRRRLWALATATAACYAVGYPLALVAGSPAGWLLVGLGGVLLLAVGAAVVRGLAGQQQG